MSPIRSFKNHTPHIAPSAYIDAACVIAGDVVIGEESSVWPFCAIRGDINSIRIGRRTNIQDNSTLHVGYRSENNAGAPLVIGDNVTVGHNVVLHGCTIGDAVLIGMGSIVLDKAVIESQVMIGAGSLVPPNKTLASGFLYVGSPVKPVRPLTTEELAYLLVSADRYVETMQAYQSL